MQREDTHILQDDIFARLLTFPNVIITGHQAFFTQEAMENIAKTTLSNISDFEQGHVPKRTVFNEISKIGSNAALSAPPDL